MTDQPAEPAPDTGAMPPEPQPPHEGPVERLEDWFHGHGHAVETDLKAAATITRDAAPMVHGHAADVLHVVAQILAGAAANPGLMALAPEAIRIGAGALQLAEAAL